LRELPEAAKIEQLTIIDLEDNRIVFETTVSENIDENIKALVAQLRSLRAKRFVSSSFTDKVEVTGELQPWRYRLDTTISLPSSTSEQTEISSLYLSPRLGGATQLAGSAEFDTVFEVIEPDADGFHISGNQYRCPERVNPGGSNAIKAPTFVGTAAFYSCVGRFGLGFLC